MTQTNPLELSKQGDPKAIAHLINRALQPLKITVKASVERRRLLVFAEGQEVPNQQSLVRIIQRGIVDLDIVAIDTFKVYGRRAGDSLSSWSQEVELRLPQVADSQFKATTKAKETFAQLSIFVEQTTYLLKTLFKRIQKIRISKKVYAWFIASVLFILTAVGSVAGFNLWQARSLQAETVTKAHTLISQADGISRATNLDSLKASEQKLKEASILLASIPNSPGGLHSQAQSELSKVQSQIGEIEQRRKVEEESGALFETADRNAQIAIESVKQPPQPLEVWQQAKTDLEQAISTLSSVPPGTFVYEQVKTKLPGYKKSYTSINKALSAEQRANQALLTAEAAAEQAINVTRNTSSYTIEILQDAQSKWQKAISLLKNIPPKTGASLAISNRMSVYTNNYKAVSNGIKEIKNCGQQDAELVFSSSCESIYLDLSIPPSTTVGAN